MATVDKMCRDGLLKCVNVDVDCKYRRQPPTCIKKGNRLSTQMMAMPAT